MPSKDSAETLALEALVQLMDHDALRDRFLALSGLSPDDLRLGLNDPERRTEVCLAILDFFIHSESDLVVLADLLEQPPEALVAAWRALGGAPLMD